MYRHVAAMAPQLKLLGRDDEMSTKILICDDRQEGCEEARSKLRDSGCEITMLHGDSLRQGLKALFETRTIPDELSGFDIAIVDNNLSDLDFGGAILTAEAVIGHIRAFTEIDYIVSLNKNPNVDFDLRHLYGDHESIADLALNTRHLSLQRLWRQPSVEDFAPWYWPHLPEAAAKRNRQIDFVRNHLKVRIWEALGFPPSAMNYVSRRATGALNPKMDVGQGIQEVTFSDFFQINRSLPPEMRDGLRGSADEGDSLALEAIARVAAAEFDRWLRKEVLVLQDVLIDVPHLLSRMPILLGEAVSDLSSWNDAVAQFDPPYGLDGVLFKGHVEKAEFRCVDWVPSPCFWWPELKIDDVLRNIFFESEGNWPDAVFCEDVSMFLVAEPSGDDPEPREFEADIEGSWPRRYVAMKADVNFSPRSRII